MESATRIVCARFVNSDAWLACAPQSSLGGGRRFAVWRLATRASALHLGLMRPELRISHVSNCHRARTRKNRLPLHLSRIFYRWYRCARKVPTYVCCHRFSEHTSSTPAAPTIFLLFSPLLPSFLRSPTLFPPAFRLPATPT